MRQSCGLSKITGLTANYRTTPVLSMSIVCETQAFENFKKYANFYVKNGDVMKFEVQFRQCNAQTSNVFSRFEI